MSTDDELVEWVRTLRAQGCTPKQIARTVGVPAARVTALVRAMAAEQVAANPHQLVGCWVSPRWSGGLTVTGHPEWPDVDFDQSELHGGLANVVVARQERRHRVRVCGYLVDTYCLGLKNTLGPRSMATGDLAVRRLLLRRPPRAAAAGRAGSRPASRVRWHRVRPWPGIRTAPDVDLVAGHLGDWTPPSAITFGRNGQPLYVQGPRDNAASITATLNRTVGKGNYHYVLQTTV